ncbi:MAG: hypothetical protein AABN33_10400 [Acidobacteriota bacterium]
MIVEEAAAATDNLEELERLYSLRKPIHVRRFLNEHAFLARLLVAACDITKSYFAPLGLALEVIAEPDSTNDQQLVLFVRVELTCRGFYTVAAIRQRVVAWRYGRSARQPLHQSGVPVSFDSSDYPGSALLHSRQSVITSEP